MTSATDNRTTELVSREATTLLEEFLCRYQNILLSRGINANEAVCKQNELIDEYAERIGSLREMAGLKVLSDSEPGVLYIHGLLDGVWEDYTAIEVDGHRFERVRECELEYHNIGWVSCSECNRSWQNDRPHVYRRCPYCGARVKGVDA